MPPTAKIILDSVSPSGVRLTTMEVTMHRFVLAEFNTHRAFSRNSASSRAIPVEKQLKRVIDDPAYPLVWAGEQSGMQGAELDEFSQALGRELFKFARSKAISEVEAYLKIVPEKENRIHKSLINRLLEPFMWHTVIVSSTEWQNFFVQRCSPLAQPEMRIVAEMMRDALNSSTPELVHGHFWHMPYVSEEERYDGHSLSFWKRVSAARCARVSYLTHDGQRDPYEDLALYDRLRSAEPPHYSPFEHVATPRMPNDHPVLGNFQGWHQMRHFQLED